MQIEEIDRRVNLNNKYIGTPMQKNGLFCFTNDGQPVEGNPVVYFKGPTTKVVRRTFADAGFIVYDDQKKFNILWGNPQSSDFVEKLMPGQKIPHIAGQQCLIRKDSLADTMENACRRSQIFRFAPKSFSLPEAYSSYQSYAKQHPGYYVVKKANAARGEGVKVIHSDDSIQLCNAVVQEYIQKPFLIDGRKFDLRCYVCVTSVEPLIAYIFDEGLGRFATMPFQKPTQKNLNDKTVHLTNYSVNKNSGEDIDTYKWKLSQVLQHFDKTVDPQQCRRQFEELDTYPCNTNSITIQQQMPSVNIKKPTKITNSKSISSIKNDQLKPSEIAMKNIQHVVKLTLIAAEYKLVSSSNSRHTNSFPRKQFGFYGFDIMFQEDLSAQLVEVNVNPSTATENRPDQELKFHMLRDMLQLVGLECHLKDKQVIIPQKPGSSQIQKRSTSAKQNSIVEFHLEPGEQKLSKTQEQLSQINEIPFSTLSRFEKLVVNQLQNEMERKGNFIQVLPDAEYNQFYENQRYLNLLINKNIIFDEKRSLSGKVKVSK